MPSLKITFGQPHLKKHLHKACARVVLNNDDETEVVRSQSGELEISIGVGEKKLFTRRKLVLLARQIVSLARTHKIKTIFLNFSEFAFPHLKMGKHEVAELLAVNFEMANFEFVKYKTPPPRGWDFVKEVVIDDSVDTKTKEGFENGLRIGEEVNACRVLSNTPGGEMTPTFLAHAAKKAARGTKVKIDVLDEKRIARLNMGGVLGVARGSEEKPKFIVLEYSEGGRENPIILVGKGVTYDSGGLSLKPSQAMFEMHMDMSGGAAVIHAVVLAAKLGLKKNVIGLVPAVENMPSGSSYRPGDVLKMMSGATVEVLNTDAEGRIILADGLTYAKKYNPRLVVDVATLTGASLVALGQRASAIFSKDEKLLNLFQKLGEESGDYAWPLPLWDEYEEEIKGTFGDFTNTQKAGGKYGGTITAAMFLYQFAKDFPWVHIDIAPRMTTIEGEYLAKGAAGAPVRLLIKLIETY